MKSYQTGSANPQWKGGIIYAHGYRKLRVNGGYAFEHRLIVEARLGRKLHKSELVHHKNGNKLDNWIENLELTTRATHQTLHKGQPHFVPKQLSDQFLLEKLYNYAKELGHAPSPTKLGSKFGMPSLHTYQNRFGCWSKALRLRVYKHPNTTIHYLQQLYAKGMNRNQISKQTGIPYSVVNKYVKNAFASAPLPVLAAPID